MKIGIYSDPHISFTSSILPTYTDNKYSARLQMCLDSFEWMYKTFYKNDVSLICCCGDLTDKYSLRADEITALSECLAFNYNKMPEIHITGNHDMLNTEFYSTSILKLFNHIRIYSKPCQVDDRISVIPYMKSKSVTHDLLKNIKNDIVLTHLDISGSHFRSDYVMDNGIDPEMLSMYFKCTMNGHLHTRECIKPNVWNVGSLTSSSFSDNNSYHPGVIILDTYDFSIEKFDNPHAYLFRKVNINTISDMIKYLDSLDERYSYVLRVICPYDCKDSCRKLLEDNSNVFTYRIISTLSSKQSSITMNEAKEMIHTESLESEMLKYLNDNSSILKYPIQVYQDILSK